jgi:hypothetical protein
VTSTIFTQKYKYYAAIVAAGRLFSISDEKHLWMVDGGNDPNAPVLVLATKEARGSTNAHDLDAVLASIARKSRK